MNINRARKLAGQEPLTESELEFLHHLGCVPTKEDFDILLNIGRQKNSITNEHVIPLIERIEMEINSKQHKDTECLIKHSETKYHPPR